MALSEQDLVGAAVATGLIAAEQVEDIRREARRQRLHLVDAVSRFGRIPVPAMWQAAAEQRGLLFLSPRALAPAEEDLERLPAGFAARRQCLPLRDAEGRVILALSNPDDTGTIDQAARSFGVDVIPALAHPDALAGAIDRALGESGAEIEAEGAVSLVEEIISDALLANASDIHLEPGERRCRVRLRVDGRLQDWRRDLRLSERDAVMNRIKVLADLDIAENRAPQDGAFDYELGELFKGRVEIRVSCLPVKWGERITMRLLGMASEHLNLQALGLPEQILEEVDGAIHRPHGVILVTGPTGSGKSTTLYAALRELDRQSLNVMTVEDPIEQIVQSTAQVQVSVKVGFAGALRSILRQDPDVILIGEIRDTETADIALKASQTGHLVFSTLHTNNAVGAVTRLLDLGVGNYQISSSVEGIIAQRLVRCLCDRCKTPQRPTEAEAALLNVNGQQADIVYGPQGCPACMGTGYRGRTGVFEALWLDSHLREMISNGAGEIELLRQATRYHSLLADLARKVAEGVTDFTEARRFGLGLDH
ncbi:MAG: ATPase, T2SS/T4P/T4SS family [Pseudomonadota bacterium]